MEAATMYCLSFFDLCLLITPVVSTNFSVAYIPALFEFIWPDETSFLCDHKSSEYLIYLTQFYTIHVNIDINLWYIHVNAML